MYEIIVYDKKKSYVLYGNSKDLRNYPTIPVGASVFILDTLEVFHKQGPENSIQVDGDNETSDNPSENPEALFTSKLGAAIIGQMNIGE